MYTILIPLAPSALNRCQHTCLTYFKYQSLVARKLDFVMTLLCTDIMHQCTAFEPWHPIDWSLNVIYDPCTLVHINKMALLRQATTVCIVEIPK